MTTACLPDPATPAPAVGTLRVERHLERSAVRRALEADVRAGLTEAPKTLPPKWFYDARGSQLFDAITRLPEYYPTRTERALLQEHAHEVAEVTDADTLIELGSGTSEKTRILLDAMRENGALRRYVPFDVDESILTQAADEVLEEYRDVAVQALVGDFEQHLHLLPRGGRRVVAFLGGTIGNLLASQRAAFLRTLSAGMVTGDGLLLGTDMVKDPQRLVRAYDDSAGVTAEFNLNVLHVLIRELEAELDPDAFAHLAVWNAEQERIEMHLQAVRQQVVRVLDLEVSFEEGETLMTETSAKFRRAGVEAELAAAGLEVSRWWTDPRGDYALSLARKP